MPRSSTASKMTGISKNVWGKIFLSEGVMYAVTEQQSFQGKAPSVLPAVFSLAGTSRLGKSN